MVLGLLGLVLLSVSCESDPDRTTGPATQRPATRPNIVFVVGDALRADRLGCYGHEGSLTPRLDGETQVSFSSSFGREYIKHTLPGTAAGQPEGHAWSFEWTAPPDDVGPVTFYAAGNAANNNGNNSGDYIYTTSALVPLPEPGSTTLGATALALAAVLASRLRRR